MTREELLAQSQDAYMNDEQTAFFETMLKDKAASIRQRIALNQELCNIDRQADVGDSASVEEERSKATRLIEMDIVTLKQIDLALAAISAGEYGFCAETGEEIGLQRLLLVPESLLCVDAMRSLELKTRHLRAA